MSRGLLERTRFPTSLQHSGLGTGAARRLEETKDIDVGEVCGGTSGTSGAVSMSPSGVLGDTSIKSSRTAHRAGTSGNCASCAVWSSANVVSFSLEPDSPTGRSDGR